MTIQGSMSWLGNATRPRANDHCLCWLAVDPLTALQQPIAEDKNRVSLAFLMTLYVATPDSVHAKSVAVTVDELPVYSSAGMTVVIWPPF